MPEGQQMDCAHRSLCAITYWHVHLLPQTIIRPDHCSGKGWMEQRKGNQLNILKRTKCLPGAICIPDVRCHTFITD